MPDLHGLRPLRQTVSQCRNKCTNNLKCTWPTQIKPLRTHCDPYSTGSHWVYFGHYMLKLDLPCFASGLPAFLDSNMLLCATELPTLGVLPKVKGFALQRNIGLSYLICKHSMKTVLLFCVYLLKVVNSVVSC